MNYWWAYIHKEDKQLHIKRYFSPTNGMDDIQHAIQEMKDGNSFIYSICPYPLLAGSIGEAAREALTYFFFCGLELNWEMGAKEDPAPAPNPLDRFSFE